MVTQTGDILLIYHKGIPTSYARVEGIIADTKPFWWQITLLLLTIIPAQKVTWILREDYIDGVEFTMNGNLLRLEKINLPQFISVSKKNNKKNKVISLTEWRKKHK